MLGPFVQADDPNHSLDNVVQLTLQRFCFMYAPPGVLVDLEVNEDSSYSTTFSLYLKMYDEPIAVNRFTRVKNAGEMIISHGLWVYSKWRRIGIARSMMRAKRMALMHLAAHEKHFYYIAQVWKTSEAQEKLLSQYNWYPFDSYQWYSPAADLDIIQYRVWFHRPSSDLSGDMYEDHLRWMISQGSRFGYSFVYCYRTLFDLRYHSEQPEVCSITQQLLEEAIDAALTDNLKAQNEFINNASEVLHHVRS